MIGAPRETNIHPVRGKPVHRHAHAGGDVCMQDHRPKTPIVAVLVHQAIGGVKPSRKRWLDLEG